MKHHRPTCDGSLTLPEVERLSFAVKAPTGEGTGCTVPAYRVGMAAALWPRYAEAKP